MSNAATPRNAVKIVNSRALSLLEQLMLGARGLAVPSPAAACPASVGAACAGNGSTASAYIAPRQTYWAVDFAGEDFETGRTYHFRCRY